MGVIASLQFDVDLSLTAPVFPTTTILVSRSASMVKFGAGSAQFSASGGALYWSGSIFQFTLDNVGAIGFWLYVDTEDTKVDNFAFVIREDISNDGRISLVIENDRTVLQDELRVRLRMDDNTGTNKIDITDSSLPPETSAGWHYVEINFLWNDAGGTTEMSWDGTVIISSELGDAEDRSGLAPWEIFFDFNSDGVSPETFLDEFFIYNTVQNVGNFTPPTQPDTVPNPIGGGVEALADIQQKINEAYELSVPMYDISNPGSLKDGLTVSDEAYYKDGAGAWTSLAISDTFTEIGSTGIYTIELSAGEMDHDQIAIKVAAAGAPDTFRRIRTFTADIDDALQPTTAGRKLDVTATGEAGIDYNNVNGTHPNVDLANDAITASKYDEATAFPLAKADSGNDEVARTGADNDTLETLSDQIDGISVAGLGKLASGTAQGGAAGSITLAAGESTTDDLFNGARVALVGGTGAGQSRIIEDYDGGSRAATIGPVNWITNPDATSQYEVQPADAHVGLIETADPSDAIRDSILDDATRFSGADIAATLADTNEMQGKLPDNNIMGSSVTTDKDDEIDAIVADTNEIQSKLPDNNIMGSSVTSNKDDEIDTIAGTVANIETDTQNIQSRLPASLSSGKMNSDMTAISSNSGAADNLEEGAKGIVPGAAVTGTLSTTQMSTDLPGTVGNLYKDRSVVWTSGNLNGESKLITGYDGGTKVLTYELATAAPSDGDTFDIT